MNLLTKQEQIHRLGERIYGYLRRRDNQGVWNGHVHTAIFKMDNQGGGREAGSGWGAHVNTWLIHVNVWQKPPQYCKVISLQLIKINEKK